MSQWVEHVKKYAAKNKVPYRDALSLAKESYQSETKTKPVPKLKAVKPNKKLEAILPPSAPVKKPAKKRVAKKKLVVGGNAHICAGCGFCND